MEFKRLYRVKESKYKARGLDKGAGVSFAEVLQHIVMLPPNMLTIQHPLTTINCREYKCIH